MYFFFLVEQTRFGAPLKFPKLLCFCFLGAMETGGWDFKLTESCKVAKQYENNVYMPTLDGVYNISLIKKPKYDTYMKKLKIVITGTQIALQSRSRLQEWEGLYKSLVEIK